MVFSLAMNGFRRWLYVRETVCPAAIAVSVWLVVFNSTFPVPSVTCVLIVKDCTFSSADVFFMVIGTTSVFVVSV